MNLNAVKIRSGDFPGGPVAKTPCSQCWGPGFSPWSGTSSLIPQLRVCMTQVIDPACYSKDPAQPNK